MGWLFIVAAGLNGGAFLHYNKDVNSLLMALFFGAAVLCYAISIYLLMRRSAAQGAGRAGESGAA